MGSHSASRARIAFSSSLAILCAGWSLAPNPAFAQATVVSLPLPSGSGDDFDPGSLDVIHELVAPLGVPCQTGTRCVLRGFYANSGVSSSNPARLRPFEIRTPIPSPISLLSVEIIAPVANFNDGIPKKPGPQAVTVNSSLAFCSIAERWKAGAPGAEVARQVSVVDAMTNTYDPGNGEIGTDLIDPGTSGASPEGSVEFLTKVNGRWSRFLAVANYREGTVTIFNLSNVANITAVREIAIDEIPNNGNATTPYGDLSRAIATVKVSDAAQNPLAGKTVLLVGLNFDPLDSKTQANLDWDECEGPLCPLPPPPGCAGNFPDEGFQDQLVILDVSALSAQNLNAPIPITAIATGPSRFGTITSVSVRPDGEAAYLLAMDQKNANSCDEQPWFISIDLLSAPLPSMVSNLEVRSLFDIQGNQPVPPDFANTSGHCPFVRNEQLQDGITDRIYIPAFASGSGSGRILVLEMNTLGKFTPTVHRMIEHSSLAGLHVQDLVHVPNGANFYGPNLARNLLIGVAGNPVAANGGRFLAVEDR